jgi:5-methylcytosine-specific restriction endonuclease McrA
MQSSNGGSDRPIDKVMPAESVGLLTRDEAWAKGKCVDCKEVVLTYMVGPEINAPLAPPGTTTEYGVFSTTHFHTEAGKREWQITGFCEKCFDKVMAGDL